MPESLCTDHDPVADPPRMYLIVRRHALSALGPACQLAGAAAVACVRRFAQEELNAQTWAQWRVRPRKVVLRARESQWERVRALPHVLAAGRADEAVIALPPRAPAARGELLAQLQAMSADLGRAAEDPAPLRPGPLVTYLLNPLLHMSSGKTMAQVAHAALLTSEHSELGPWVTAGCPAHVQAPASGFAELARSPRPLARVVDAGITEVPPGTITVLAVLTRH